MQTVEFVKNGELDKVSKHLTNGYKVVGVYPVAETIALDGCTNVSTKGHSETGNVYAYFVLEK